MDDLKKLAAKLEELGTDWETFKETNDKRIDDLADQKGVAELDEKLEKIDGNITSILAFKQEVEVRDEAQKTRIDELEAALDRKGPTGNASEKSAAEYLEKFDEWLRSSKEAADNNNSAALSLRGMEAKDVTIGTGSAGGFAVPAIIARAISEQAQIWSPVRQDVKVVQVGSSDYKELVDLYGATSGWVGETDSRTGTGSPTLRERAPTMGTVYAYPQATEEAMQDIFFNVGGWLTDHASFEIARAEGLAVLLGNGTNKPTGMLNGTPVATGDGDSPIRSAEVLEFVPLLTSSPAAFDGDGLLDLVYKLRAQYRINARWAMNSLTMGTIRKLRDTANGGYLWAPGLTPGQPGTLLGYPVRAYEDLADIAANSLSILFGDFRRGYMMVDRSGLRISVDDNLTTPGYVKFYIRRRVGGILLDNNAIKVGKYAAAA